MSGYKRVNFYELCRLCASNQQKEKTHIFHEEGRKIQLQSKIQLCLSLKVCENDFLPKVVCSQCLRTLEECYTFRNECVTSESMLSSYFNNFRHTEDFKKSGKVYIKDQVAIKTQQNNKQTFDFISIPNSNVSSETVDAKESICPTAQNEPKTSKTEYINPVAYNLNNLNGINFAALKGIVQNIPRCEQLNNISVSSSGEIINITPLIDIESLLAQNQKPKQISCKTKKVIKEEKNECKADKYDKFANIKNTQPGKYAYAIKIEESTKNGGGGAAVVVNNLNVPISNNSQYNTNYPNQGNNVNWGFTNSNTNLTNNANLVGSNNQTIFNQTNNWNLITTTANVSNNLTPGNVVQNSNADKPQEKQHNNVLNTRNGDIQTVDISSIKTEQSVKTFGCDICPKVFKRREHLYQHMKLHTGFRPFRCANCKKAFMRKEHLMRHITSHTGQKNFTCNICEKSFSRNDNLLKHKKTHEKQTSFTCEICQKQFVMKHYYLAHKIEHESTDKFQYWNVLKT